MHRTPWREHGLGSSAVAPFVVGQALPTAHSLSFLNHEVEIRGMSTSPDSFTKIRAMM